MEKSNDHFSVQKNKAISNLCIKKDGIYVDCTFGRGGHSKAILNELSPNGLLISIDKDKDAKKYYEENFDKFSNHIFINDSFSNLKQILNKLNIDKVDGFIFDFGVSSPMLDNAERGFSFNKESKLDMRMDQDQSFSAYELINNYSESELNRIFRNYGDIKNPYYVIKNIINSRQQKPIYSTIDLVKIIEESISKKELYKNKHFATKYFQAIRIEVNDEINEIKKGVSIALDFLSSKGRIVTISFHSLEERTIKNILNSKLPIEYPKEIPLNNLKNEYKIINVKNKWADKEEIKINNRSRSSIIKIIERN